MIRVKLRNNGNFDLRVEGAEEIVSMVISDILNPSRESGNQYV